ncbi:MAG: maleylacetoacetate isomerase [Steroidobacteraceae bacterium]
MRLYSFWRSQATFRVRIALALKGLAAEMKYVDLLKNEHMGPEYRELNPAMMLPTLIDGQGPPLVQSLAILEYLDETYPNPRLLPQNTRDRAHVRALSHAVAADVLPLIVPRVRNYLDRELHVDEPSRMEWLQHWLDAGSRVIEEMLCRDSRTGRFCYGDAPTMADVCLIPHVTSAQMLYRCDFSAYPTIRRIVDAATRLQAFADAHPIRQVDARPA